tara:strand:- start:1052 stop:2839 length:1788 start_codon:yes stop_codon:yes gene_type:complete
MASKFETLKKLLSGGSAQYKVPTERPSMRTQKNVFDSFQKAASSIYQQGFAGGVERLERYRDYEEMDHYPEITRALDIYADDSMVYGAEGKVLKIVSDDDTIVEELEELFYERLDIEFHLWTWIRNMVKYGDHFNLLDLVEGEGVLGAIALPISEIVREEGFDNDPNSLRFNWAGQGNTAFQNYQISHMRILGDDRFLPYGRSILDSTRKVYKQLIMAEDAMLIYRITRAPERRVFYVDVGNIPPAQVDSYLMQARDKLKRTPLVNQTSGQQDMRFNPESILEDFFVPIRGDRGSRIETLPGGENAAAIEDIEYLQNKMFISLGVPKSYLTAEEDLAGKGTLAQEDIKFARTIQRIQKITISEMAKIALIHLHLKGYDEDSIYNFDLKLTNPSSVTEMMNLDLIDKRFSTASQMMDSPLLSKEYIQKEVLQLSSADIITIKQERMSEAAEEHTVEQIATGEQSDPQPDSSPFGATEENKELKDDDEKGYSSMKSVTPYDPIGTDEIEGMPKFDSFENNFESSTDSIQDPETKRTLDFVLKKNKNKKKNKVDAFEKKITEIMKFDKETKRIISSMKKDTGEEGLSETAKVYFVTKD